MLSDEDKLGFISKVKAEFSFVRGNYLLLILSWILMDFALELPSIFYAPYVIYDLHGTPTILGLIGFVSLLIVALMQFPGGYLADKYGRKWLVSTMTIGVGISYLFYALAPSWHWILIGAVIGSFCLIYQPALWAMTADSTTPEKRGTGLSIITLINNVATTPAPIAMGIIVSVFTRSFGMRLAYAITVLSFFVAAAFRNRLKETIESPQKMRFRDLFQNYPQAVKQSRSVWRTLPKPVLYLFIVSALTMFAYWLSSLFLAVYALEGQESVLHINQTDWATLNTTLFLMMIIVAFPIGKVIDRYGRRIPLALSLLLMISAVLLFVYGDLFKLFLAFPVMGAAQILFFASFSSLQTDYVPSDKRGVVVGSSNFLNSIVGGLAQLTGGIMYEISHQLPFLIIPPVLLIAFALTLLLVREPQKRQD